MPAAPSHEISPPARRWPSWLISVALHGGLIVLLGWLYETAPRGLPADEPGREVGIVFKRLYDGEEQYEDESEEQSQNDAADVADGQESSTVEALESLPTAATASVDPSDALPQLPVIGPGAIEAGQGVAAAGAMTTGAQQPKTGGGRKAGVSVYGLPAAEGSKFVFVFDRSDSMAGPPLASAKQQLANALSELGTVHQFQIIFFNHDKRVFDLSGGQNRIPFATSHNKELASRFIGGITADGGTDRYAALLTAVGLRPDVIFFLSDADGPMTAAEVEQVRIRNRGIASIHCIEFGFGPSIGGQNFLKRLAAQNAGGYVYVDVTQLGR